MPCPLTYVHNAYSHLPAVAAETRLEATTRRHRALTTALELTPVESAEHANLQHGRAILLRCEDALASPIENDAALAGQAAGLESITAPGVSVQPVHSRFDRVAWFVRVDGEVVAIEAGATAATISATSRARKLNRS